MGSFKRGDRVRLQPGATSALGKPLPTSVFTLGCWTSISQMFTDCACDIDTTDGGCRIEAGQRYWTLRACDLLPLEAPANPVAAQPTTHASLERVFALAVAQSRDGKGADRHGNGKPFEEQPIVRDIAELGSNHGAIAQVRKKALESTRLAATGRKDMAMAELLGAMVYAGAAYLILEAECPGTT